MQTKEDQNKNKLDYTIQSAEERVKFVQQIIARTPAEKLTKRYLQILADYIIFAMTKEERKNKTINTQNRLITINKRETSFQGLMAKFESGEDGIYNLITEDKNILFSPKISITEQDIKTIPGLKELREAIKNIEENEKHAVGKTRSLLRKQLIQMRQDQYVLKNSYNPPIYCLNIIKNFNSIQIEDKIEVVEKEEIIDNSLISLMNPKHVSAILCNYSKIKESCYNCFYADSYYIIQDLENLIDKSLKEKHPLYYDLMVFKIDGKQNIEIQQLLEARHGIHYSIENISFLWRNKIPKIIVEQAKKDYLEWYFTEKEKGTWKKCSKCKQIKLAHTAFFHKDNSRKGGFHRICKSCRNSKEKTSTTNSSAIDTCPRIIKRISYIKLKKEEGDV